MKEEEDPERLILYIRVCSRISVYKGKVYYTGVDVLTPVKKIISVGGIRIRPTYFIFLSIISYI